MAGVREWLSFVEQYRPHGRRHVGGKPFMECNESSFLKVMRTSVLQKLAHKL